LKIVVEEKKKGREVGRRKGKKLVVRKRLVAQRQGRAVRNFGAPAEGTNE
jgi:hypothetical protein